MAEWHVTPDYIFNNWTDELLNLMVNKLVDRKKGMVTRPRGKSGDELEVPEEVMFAMLGNKAKVEKRGKY